MDIEKILENCQKNLEEERAVATGIGVFAAIVNPKKEILLRRRMEKGSLYGKDLSGRKELPGGGVDLSDFPQDPGDYQKVILDSLSREIQEETGLLLWEGSSAGSVLLPAWLCKDGLINLAFVMVVDWEDIVETRASNEKLSTGEIQFYPVESIGKDPEITSPRMKFLIQEAIRFMLS